MMKQAYHGLFYFFIELPPGQLFYKLQTHHQGLFFCLHVYINTMKHIWFYNQNKKGEKAGSGFSEFLQDDLCLFKLVNKSHYNVW